MFDDPHLSTALAKPRDDVNRWSRQEAKSQTTADELFYGVAKHPQVPDSTGNDRCHPLTLAGLIAAAILSAALTAYIGMYGLPNNKPVEAPPVSDASHARFGPLQQ